MLMSEPHVHDGPPPAARLTFPCSSSQLRCWFVDALSPGNPALNVALRWELKGAVERSMVQRSFDLIVERHEILRTRIVDPDGMPEQEVMPGARLAVDEIDLTAVPTEARLAQALERGRAEARRPFDLAAAPLLRVTLLRLAPDHALLFVTVHQIAFDGWSIRLLSTEFAAVARALHEGVEPDLPDLPMQYGDYAAWQKAYLESGTFDTERSYWRRHLAGAPFFEVPGDRERPPRPTSNCEIIATHVPPDVSDAMLRVVKRRHVTLFSFGCAVMATALRHFTGAEDISVGTQVSGRDDPDLDPLIGVFINNLVLRFDLSRDPTFHERLDRVNATVQEALVHQRMPFHALVDLLKPPRDPRRMPLISVNFTVLQDVMDDARCGAFELLGQPSLSAGSLYDLNFFLVHWPATGWRMALEYNTDLFDPATARQLLDLWSTLLGVAVERPDFRLSELGLPARIRTAAAAPGPEAAIEAALARHAAVARAAVVGRDRPDGSRALRAFVVPAQSYAGTLDDIAPALKAHLGEVLPRDGAARRGQPAHGFADGGRRRARPRAARRAVARRRPAPPARPSRRPARRRRRRHADRDLDGAARRARHRPGLGLLRTRRPFPPGPAHAGPRRSRARAEGAPVAPPARSDHRGTGRLPRRAGSRRTARRRGPPGRTGASSRSARPPPRPRSSGSTPSRNSMSSGRRRAATAGSSACNCSSPGSRTSSERKSFEEIAADYLALIREVQPVGPYRLFGLCVHGVLAYEIAQQMRRAGDEVELLAFKSAWHPTYFARLSRLNRWSIRLSHLGGNAASVLRGRKGVFEALANYSAVRRTGLLDVAMRLGLLTAMPPKTGTPSNDEALLALMAARDAYVPPPYDGRVLQYVGPDAPRGRGFDPSLGWAGTITGPLTIREMSADGRPTDGAGRRAASGTVFQGRVASQPTLR